MTVPEATPEHPPVAAPKTTAGRGRRRRDRVASQARHLVDRLQADHWRRGGRDTAPLLQGRHLRPAAIQVARLDHAEVVRYLLVPIVERRHLQGVHERAARLRVIEQLHGKHALESERLLEHRKRRAAGPRPVQEVARVAEHFLGVEATGAAPRLVDVHDAEGFVGLGDDPRFRRWLESLLNAARQPAWVRHLSGKEHSASALLCLLRLSVNAARRSSSDLHVRERSRTLRNFRHETRSFYGSKLECLEPA